MSAAFPAERLEGRRPSDSVDFPAVIAHRQSLWPRVLERFDAAGAGPMRDRFERFCREQAHWLDDFALFMAIKEAHGQAAWTAWEPDIAHRDPAAIANGRPAARARSGCTSHAVSVLRAVAARARGVPRAIASRSSATCRSSSRTTAPTSGRNSELFHLDADGRPTVVAGVPPDYFSATGQLWGNPLYRWDVLATTGYAWWVERFRAAADAGRSASASITSAASRRPGKCRPTPRRRSTARG